MANPDNRRKTPGNINLDKGERSTDLEKEGTQVPELTVEEEAAQQNNSQTTSGTTTSRSTTNPSNRQGSNRGTIPPSSAPEPEKRKGNGRAWLWVICAIVAVVIIVWIMPKSCTEAKEDNEPSKLTETVKTVEADSVATTKTDSVVAAVTTLQEVSEPKGNDKPTTTSVPTVESNSKVGDNVEQEALNVIRGEYGNNPQRRSALGKDYEAVQRRVNQMMKSGKY
ncbi:MAG: hypothetical protein K2H47_01250 [Muribaculaceae bacterium]|nr:hypothetical protein [Muribaculaceae bacterium]